MSEETVTKADAWAGLTQSQAMDYLSEAFGAWERKEIPPVAMSARVVLLVRDLFQRLAAAPTGELAPGEAPVEAIGSGGDATFWAKHWHRAWELAEANFQRVSRELAKADTRGADRLARAVADLVRRKVIDARSPAGDALLDFAPDLCTMTPTADQLPDAEVGPPFSEQEMAALREWARRGDFESALRTSVELAPADDVAALRDGVQLLRIMMREHSPTSISNRAARAATVLEAWMGRGQEVTRG